MGKALNFYYDKDGDILDIAIGKPQAAISREVGDDIVIRIHPETGKVVGFTVLNFEARFRSSREAYSIPVSVEAQMMSGSCWKGHVT